MAIGKQPHKSNTEGMTLMGLPLLLSIDRVAAELGINRATVYAKLIAPGLIKSVRIGRARRVARQDLEAYVQRLREGEGGKSTCPQ